MDSLANLLINVPDFRDGLFSMLGATDVSIVAQLCRIDLTSNERTRYLHLIRDMNGLVRMADVLVGTKCNISLVGMDVKTIVDRIKDPIGYWKANVDRRTLTFWLHINDERLEKFREQVAMSEAYSEIMSMSDDVEIVSTCTMIATFNADYPHRLVMMEPMQHLPAFLWSGIDYDDESTAPLKYAGPTMTRISITTAQVAEWTLAKTEDGMTMYTYITELLDSNMTITSISTDHQSAPTVQLLTMWANSDDSADDAILGNIYGNRIIFTLSDYSIITFTIVPMELTKVLK